MRRTGRVLGAIVGAVLCASASLSAAVAFGSNGTATGFLTSATNIPNPATVNSGDLLLMCVVTKYPTNTIGTPTGYSLLTNGTVQGGHGSNGVDTGSVYVNVFQKTADGTEGGTNVSVQCAACDSGMAVILRYTKGSATVWNVAATNGTDTTPASGAGSWSITGAADPGVIASDMLVTCNGVNSDAFLYSSEAMSQTGITFGTASERVDTFYASGQDLGVFVSDHAVSSGTSSDVPVFTATASAGATADAPAGAGVIVRLRELSSAHAPGLLGIVQ